ncbi:protein PHOTOPERIOD-INDEPENDENT EARLY FLOWERING 1 isoform X2 [Tripterygium wilfordii]|uniref:DNA helicase n=1 Tax=Tripterygium wilfordii TaxID=458696 RepID=A0A7J7DC55_TRIWF|nr:protein PHOTOPERIOD-INDEPENDENT EARLY FLOWERING 1 isoform X2 [Tripterygium wilfordii]
MVVTEPPADVDDDFDIESEDETEDDEQTIEEDEALVTEEERQEELAALHSEIDLPLEELLKRYAVGKGKEDSLASVIDTSSSLAITGRHCDEINGALIDSENHVVEYGLRHSKNLSNISGKADKGQVLFDFGDEQEDGDFVLATGEEMDDETTLLEEEELAKADLNDPIDEITLLQKESEIPLEELLIRYKKDFDYDEASEDGSDYASPLSEDLVDSPANEDIDMKQQDMSTNEVVEPCECLQAAHPFEEEREAAPENNFEEGRGSEDRIADAAAAARSAQPTGNTFSTTNVRTKFPFLVKHPLREYQHIGLDWLVTMYEKRLNGILADEMGLGKTIMTIALLAHLACDKGIWGPHLIVVPTSVMLNWKTELLKWCPAFKILTYFGSAKERKVKRQGWLKPNSFHICITTYRLVIQDSKVFKRKKWKYLILDEAHLIKNWKSQRWQTLLNFNSKRRILLTGTPLQNDLMELWSLMHFLMPHIFQSHQEFKDWFSNPISGMVEGQEKVNKEVVDRLHNVLRPFILRRLKRDVEKQLPSKHEHVIYCRLSKRQRNLYEDFIASSETQATLASSNFFGMISVIMQLRKVCNHPDLFEGRPIVSSFDMSCIDNQLSSSICSITSPGPFSLVDLKGLGLLFTHNDFTMTSWESDEVKAIATPSSFIKERADLLMSEDIGRGYKHLQKLPGTNIFEDIRKAVLEERLRQAKERAASVAWWNSLKCQKKPMYSTTLRNLLTLNNPVDDIHCQKAGHESYMYSSKLAAAILRPVERFQRMIDLVESFMFAIPAARAPAPICWCGKTGAPVFLHPSYKEKCSEILAPLISPIRPALVRKQVYFPDRRLIQFDCGKLQELAILLRKLKSEGHRALIFTQMTKMLDILEAFINLYGYTYMRLDGSTPPEERQTLMQRFNTNPKIFLFILSTRSGGVGINLVGADTVIFYDSDWNPAMDQQAQDRCHRIGQTREVHIYRLISESTIEENILKKANQKRALDDLVIQSGGYNTEFFKKLDPMELFSGHRTLPMKNMPKEENCNNGVEVSVSNADVEEALKFVEDEADYMALKKVEEEEAVDNQEFTEEAIGRLEDDELANEDELKADEPLDQGSLMTAYDKDNEMMLDGNGHNEEQALSFADKDDDVDMLADVKQMAAAAAAAGQAISSFESQLSPIDRYAIRFLELWDPIVDKAAIESQVSFVEREWELDRIEKYKDDIEAEIDDDEEPLVYERWDVDFATEAYRQEVEALAQHQLMEELEYEAKLKDDADDGNFDSMNEMSRDPKPKSKKKHKKAKFKSLKKGSLTSELKYLKEEQSMELMSVDEDLDSHEFTDSDIVSPKSNVHKKRKKTEITVEEEKHSKKFKKIKKGLEVDSKFNLSGKQHYNFMELKSCESMVLDLEKRHPSRSKMGGKISITTMPLKRVLMIKPEKLKKGNLWSRDCVPSPDFWLSQEDAILCAVVHEYGPHWNLVSDILYGMTAGGFYRGRYRHPVHCCERFRELVQKYVLSASDNPTNEKPGNAGSGKALLKVTEDNIRMLLQVSMEQQDNEFILQRHFTALLSSVWRVSSRCDGRQSILSSQNGLYFGGKFFSSAINPQLQSVRLEPTKGVKFTNLGQSSKLIAAALRDTSCRIQDTGLPISSHVEVAPAVQEHLEITLEFCEKDNHMFPLPCFLNLSISGTNLCTSVNEDLNHHHLRASKTVADNRLRAASRACVEGSLDWASSAFAVNDMKTRSASKSQTLGKHKLSTSESIKPPKSKLKKTLADHVEMRQTFNEPAFPPMVTGGPNNSDLLFDLAPAITYEDWTDDLDCDSPFGLNKLLSSELVPFESVPPQYVPGLTSGLDDHILNAEFTDIMEVVNAEVSNFLDLG